MTAIIYGQSSLLIVSLLFVAMVLSGEVGYWIGLRFKGSVNELTRGQINAIQASMLGILALILGFTFSRSLDRYNARSEAVVDEANAIGTAYLRAKVTPPSVREPAQKLLRDYLTWRVEAGQRSYENLDISLIQKAEKHQTDLWQYAEQAVAEDPGPVSVSFLSSINELIDSYGRRKATIARHVPAVVVFLLLSMFVLTALVVGFASGAEGHRPAVTCHILAFFIVVLVFVIIDLDRPRRGMIEVPQQSLLDLQTSIRAETGVPGVQQ